MDSATHRITVSTLFKTALHNRLKHIQNGFCTNNNKMFYCTLDLNQLQIHNTRFIVFIRLKLSLV